MIFTNRTITVRKGESRIDEPIVVYRGDYELEVRFIILNSKFKFKSGTNMIETEKASYGQLAILTPYGGNIFSDIVKCNDGSVTFVLTADMLNQIEEVGLYSFQIRLMDYNKESRVSIPPIEFGIEVREPIASEDHDNSVNNAIVGYSIAKVVNPKEENVGDTFDESGNYNKTKWKTGNRISEGKLNKIEDAIDVINRNEKNNTTSLSKRIDNNFNVLDVTKADKNEIFTMANMGQDVKEAMTGGSVAVVGDNAVLANNILDKQVTNRKIADKAISYEHIAEYVNLFNPDTCLNDKIASVITDEIPTGYKEYPGYMCTDFIPVIPGDTIEIADGRVTNLVVYYDENKTPFGGLRGYAQGEINKPLTFNFIPDTNVKYFRVNVNKNSPFYQDFYIYSHLAKRYIRWFEVGENNLNDELKRYYTSIKKTHYMSSGLRLDAIPGYLPNNVRSKGGNLLDISRVVYEQFISGDGEAYSNEKYPYLAASDFIDVLPSTVYTSAVDSPSHPILVEYDVDKKLVTSQHRGNKKSIPYTFETSSITKYVRLNLDTSMVPIDEYYFVEGTDKPSDLTYMPALVIPTGNLFDKNTVHNDKFIAMYTGELVSNEQFPTVVCSDYISVMPGMTLKFNFNDVSDWFAEYDAEYNYITGHKGRNTDTVTLTNRTRFIIVNINTSIITLDDFYVIYTGLRDYQTFTWLEDRLSKFSPSSGTPSTPNTPNSSGDIITSRFNGMTVLVTGDSITEKNFRANISWHDYLKEWYGWSKVYNDGRSGSGLVKNNGIVYRLPNWETNYGTADTIDMILIMGPMNDGTSGDTGKPEWLGTFADQDASMKTASLYGALHYTCQEIIRMYPNIPIGFIISQPRSQVGDQGKCWGIDGWFEDWVKAINEVCGHYSIPVLDLYHNSGFRPWNAENNKKYFSCDSSPDGDGIHPNDLGQELMARKIYEFINRYM